MKRVNITRPTLNYIDNESYKSLRTNLLFCGEDKKVIALTSCTPNEGKSTVTLNLALSLAESGKKVLMIDADLRKSVQINKTDVDEEVLGLSHYLSKQVALKDILYATNFTNFHIIYAGVFPPNPVELLGNSRFKELLKMFREVYDYILIDTPPLGSVIDAAVIADECDGSILVIASGEISYNLAQDVKMQLEKCKCPVLGAILNKVDASSSSYYGKYYGTEVK